MNLSHHFLLSMPGVEDRRFQHSVTYLIEHSDSGAMGLTISRDANIRLGEIFTQLEIDSPASELLAKQPVYSGGPVEPERGFVIHNGGSGWASTAAITSSLWLTCSRDILADIALGIGPKKHLIALGYAGWGAGQLEQELLDNAWLTCPADEQILFEVDAADRYDAVTAKLGIHSSQLSCSAGHA